jgi:hypothetical protein
MSAQANIVINDGASTPVAHTFNPKGAKAQADGRDVAIWRDQSPSSFVGALSITETHTKVNQNGMEKFRYVIDVPTLEQPGSGGTFDPPPTRAYGTIAVVEVWAHERASSDELKNIVAFVKNFAATTYFSDAITKREAAW